MLGIRFDCDRTESIELAALSANWAKHLHADIRDVFSRPNRYPINCQTNRLRTTAQFQAAAGWLHAGLSNSEKLCGGKVRCEPMSCDWEDMDQLISRSNLTDDGQYLVNFRPVDVAGGKDVDAALAIKRR